MVYELISFRELILDVIEAETTRKSPCKELHHEIFQESKRIISAILHHVTQVEPDRSKTYIRQHQRGLLQLMDELGASIKEEAQNTNRKNENDNISQIANLLNQMVLELQQLFPYDFDYHCAISAVNQKQLLLNIAENSSQILKNIETLQADNVTITLFKHIFEQISGSSGRFTFEQDVYLQNFLASLKTTLNQSVPPLDLSEIILLLVSLNFNHPSFYHFCCSHLNHELQQCENISEQYRLIHFFKKLIGQVFKTINMPYNKNLPSIDESILRYIESEISYLKSIDTIAEDLSSSGILESNFKVSFTVRQLAIFINLQVEAGIILTKSPKALHQYVTKHYSTAEKAIISEKSFKNAYYGNVERDVQKVIDKIVTMLAIAQEKC